MAEQGSVGMPYLHMTRRNRQGTAMRNSGVRIHSSGRLGAAATVLAAKFPRRHRMFTKGTGETRKAVHRFDDVMSHNLIVVPSVGMVPN